MLKPSPSRLFALEVVLLVVVASDCLANKPAGMPEHCIALDQQGRWTCPSPPPDVADRADEQELRSWGIYDLPDKRIDAAGYAAWRHRNFEVHRFVPTLTELTDPGFDSLPGTPIPQKRAASPQ